MKIVKKILTAILCAALATGIAAAFAGCGHAHVWSDEWESDSAGHSHECTECGEVATEEHTYSGGVCVVCGYECEHGEWESDKLNHWQTCAECGEQFSGEHNFVSGECIVCGYECVHEYAAEWSCDTQTHWHECAICASVNGEKAHEYLLGECTECGYVCVHGGIQWEITELNHYGTCAQCGTTLSGRHEYSDGVCTVCLKPEPEVIEAGALFEDIARIYLYWSFSSLDDYTEDAYTISRLAAAFSNAKFTEGRYDWSEITGETLAKSCSVILLGYLYDDDGVPYEGWYIYKASFRLVRDGSAELIISEGENEYYYSAKKGAVDYDAIIEIYSEIGENSYDLFA